MKKRYGFIMMLFAQIDASYALNCKIDCAKDSPAALFALDLNRPILPIETLVCLQECPLSELPDLLLQIGASLHYPELWTMIGELNPRTDRYKEALQEACGLTVKDDNLHIESAERDKCHTTSRLEFYNKTRINDWAMSKDPATVKGLIDIAKSLPKSSPTYRDTIHGLLNLIKRTIHLDTNDVYIQTIDDELIELAKNSTPLSKEEMAKDS